MKHPSHPQSDEQRAIRASHGRTRRALAQLHPIFAEAQAYGYDAMFSAAVAEIAMGHAYEGSASEWLRNTIGAGCEVVASSLTVLEGK